MSSRLMTSTPSESWLMPVEAQPAERCMRPPEEAIPVASGVHAQLFGQFEDGLSLGEALAGYSSTGERCFRSLRGQFVLFVWDTARNTIWVLRDPMGSHPLFYARSRGRYFFSPSIGSLLHRPGVSARLDPLAIAEFFRDRWPSLDGTFHADVRRLPPGHALRITPDGVACERYWLRRDEPVAWLADGEEQAFEPLFEKAVTRCLGDGGAGIFLSGGLDSVAVAAMGADVSARRGMRPMHAMSLVFPDKTADESQIQRAVASQLGFSQTLAPLIETVSHGRVLSAGLDVSAQLDSPVLNVWLPAYLHLAAQGKRRGCSSILTGTGGDEWLGLTPLLGADLVRGGRILDLAALALLRWRSSDQGRSPRALWNLAWHFSMRPILRRSALRLILATAPGALAASRRSRELRRFPDWLLPDLELRRRAAQRAEQSDCEQDRRADCSFYVEELRQALDHPLASIELEEWFQAYGPLGVQVRHPFYDADLVEFLFRVSPRQLLASSRSKNLVRATLHRRFPDLGFLGQKKLEATGFFDTALRTEGPSLWKRFGDFAALGALGVVDPRRVPPPSEALHGGYRKMYRFWSLVNVEAWLRPRL